ncbi:MAG: acyltransferase [Proteobacteria bacterium]|nr:acyltransferase [Pseudomonadota bacterium]
MNSNDKEHFLKGYVRELDGMRGLAIVAVMLFHAGSPYARGGFIGVDIFFVLSGFLITALLIKEYDTTKHISLKRFYLRRVLRLAPALVLLLLVLIALTIIFLNASSIRYNAIDSVITLFYATNWARALGVHPPNLLGHTWSLSIEEQFYILWPLLLILLLRLIRSRGTIAAVVAGLALVSWGLRVLLALSGSSIDRLYNGLDTRVDTLLVGCALGVVLSSNLINEGLRKRLSRLLLFLTPVSALLLGYFFYALYWKSLHMYYWIYFVIEVLTAIIILDIFISERSIVRRILSFKVFVWVGSISYGLYLWHYPVYRVMMMLKIQSQQVLIYGSIVTLVIATLSYYLMERPILKLKKRLQRAQ